MKRNLFLLVFYVIPIMMILACNLTGDSSNELIKEALNNKGKKAILFMRSGGATVDNSLQVSIINEKSKLSGNPGNIFVCDLDKGTVSKDDVIICWRGYDTLEISYKKNLRTFIKKEQFAGVAIVYTETE